MEIEYVCFCGIASCTIIKLKVNVFVLYYANVQMHKILCGRQEIFNFRR